MSSRKLRSKGVTGSLTTFSMVVPCEAHSLSKMLSRDVRGTREGPVALGGPVLPPVVLALAAPMADARQVIFLPVARRVDDVALGIQAVDGQYERGLEGEPAEIDVVEEPELIGQVAAEAGSLST